ncbi:pilus assembly protein TadG-related protein [Streptomyces fumanus]|uniref:pilus assembly protein TadG-related protein n=1 Tax=Streptomyces fumanus TaxID=67302 RepID=UPI003404F800
MRRLRRHADAGQAFPIYITVVGGLLFLAFAYLAVGQAAANRNGAQTAADAAALAVAQDSRDQLADMWTDSLLDPAAWQDIFDGLVTGLVPSCDRAHQLAAENEAHVLTCEPDGPLGFTVAVETDRTVGDSIVPGTENKRSKASATAVIEPRCGFDMPVGETDDKTLPALSCEGERWELDPEDEAGLPRPEDLFDVHLAD